MKKTIAVILTMFLSLPLFISIVSSACKDVVVLGDATAGGFNLFMKIRDPSRPGPQVLCMINSGYSYTYHLPWTGKETRFTVERKFIGVVTKGDTPPNIIKPGIALSDAGIAYGDADVPSYWINPLRTAWDDFDWIRYACQSASNEDEAVALLREVVKMHAPGVAENMFVVGPEKGFVLEGDVIHSKISEIKDICVMSNYPKELWKWNVMMRLFVAPSFDAEKEKSVREGNILRLGGLIGVKVKNIDKDGVSFSLWPGKDKKKIRWGEGGVVGPFWVEVLDISADRAKVKMCYKYKAWEEKLLYILKEKYGEIDVADLMNISRLTTDDLDSLRGMSEGSDEGTAICKIPHRDYQYLSCMWFAPNQCSSIFVPVHICCKKIYDAYTNGSAAALSVKALNLFGRKGFTNLSTSAENVFINEIGVVENIARKMIEEGNDPSDFLTAVDLEMQKQAYLTEKIAVYLKGRGKDVPVIWNDDYLTTLLNILNISRNADREMKKMLSDVAISIAKTRFKILCLEGYKSSEDNEFFDEIVERIKSGELEEGIMEVYNFLSIFTVQKEEVYENNFDNHSYLVIAIVLLAIITLIASYVILLWKD